MDNLNKFQTESEYNEAEINFPSVSWITSTDNLHYDLNEKSPVPVPNYVMFSFVTSPMAQSHDIVLYNCGSSGDEDNINNIIVSQNGEVIFEGKECALYGVAENESTYLVKYDKKGTSIGEEFSADLGVMGDSLSFEFLIPDDITSIDFLPTNFLDSLVILATTPPTLAIPTLDLNVDAIYVPDDAVTDYQNEWIGAENKIQPLSNYQGLLPV